MAPTAPSALRPAILAASLAASGLAAPGLAASRVAAQEARDVSGADRALLDAAATGDTAAVRAALERGADPDVRDAFDGRTPLFQAAFWGHAAATRMLLESGADPDLATALDSVTPLMGALVEGHRELALLLARRTDHPDAVNGHGWSAVHAAAGENFDRVLETLLERGGDPDVRDPRTDLHTPLSLAAIRGHELAARLLLCHGASTELEDAGGNTPADLARERAQAFLVPLLEAGGCDRRAIAILREAKDLEGRAREALAGGDWATAVATARRALEVLESAGGPPSREVEAVLFLLSEATLRAGDLEDAERLTRRALEAAEALGGGGHPHYAAGLSNLGLVRLQRGDYEEARRLLTRSLELKGLTVDASGAPSLEGAAWNDETATTLDLLGGLLLDQGDLAAAAPLLELGLRIREAGHGRASVPAGLSLHNLGMLRAAQGDLETAERHLADAVAAFESALGPANPRLVRPLAHLAGARLALGRRDEARELLETAMRIAEAGLPPDHPTVAEVAVQLAAVLRADDETGRAESLLRRAAAIQEASLGADHPVLAGTRVRLGRLLRDQGRPAEARDLLEGAVGVLEDEFGPNAPPLASALDDLALAWGALGPEHLPTVRAHLDRATRILDRHLEETLVGLSAAEQRALLEGSLPRHRELLLALYREGPELERAYAFLARWKGYLVHALRRDARLRRAAREDEELAMFLQNLRRVRATLAARFHGGPAPDPWASFAAAVPGPPADAGAEDGIAAAADTAVGLPPPRWREPHELDVQALTERKESLEREVARLAAERGYGAAEPAFGVDTLRRRLPPDGVLVDVYRHRFPDPAARLEPRYAAVVLAPGRAPVLVDLGPAAALDSVVARWRREAAGGRTGEAPWRILQERLWGPVADALPAGTRRAWVSPDGSLVRLPWSLLAAGHPDTGALRVAHVGSPRGLARLLGAGARAAGPAAGERVLLVGDVDFDAPPDPYAARPADVATGPPLGPPAGDAAGAIRGGGRWAGLPATAAEVRAIAALARQAGLTATTRTGADASPDAVLAAMPEARVVHLATHGFFLPERGGAAGSRGLEREEAAPGDEALRNPLVLSGIVLAGANVPDPATNAPYGLVTAEELVGLDLSATDLVVLSACDTGRGSEVTGQGVLGLQASLAAAGAGSLLLSLWKVPDESTAFLMEAFYRGLWERGLTEAEALREARRAVRDHPSGRFRAPVHWGAWVLSGALR